jgi:hypothetical protein
VFVDGVWWGLVFVVGGVWCLLVFGGVEHDPTPKTLPREHRDLVMSVSNPCLLRINGVLCGFTSADPLLHMCSAIYARSAEQHPHSLIAEVFHASLSMMMLLSLPLVCVSRRC